MKNILGLGTKTGLKPGELNKLTKLSVLGLAALALTSLCACFRSDKAVSRPAPDAARQQSENARPPDASVNAATPPAADINPPGDSKNCGPYPGYPCGTRYYTVSVSDFRI